MQKIGIIGQGYVGGAFKEFMEQYAEVVTYDPAFDADYPSSDLEKCDFVLICVNTPAGADGRCDTSKVEAAVLQVPNDRILIKSTIAPGTTDHLAEKSGKHICFSPEYIGESRYLNPGGAAAAAMPYQVIGGAPAARRWFIDRLAPIFGPHKRYLQCSAIDAEVAKYMENAFFATKVTFVNEFRRLATAIGADWHTVREVWTADPRVTPSHTLAFADRPGFDGKCLPKDLRAIIYAAQAADYDPSLLQAVLVANDRIQAKASG